MDDTQEKLSKLESRLVHETRRKKRKKTKKKIERLRKALLRSGGARAYNAGEGNDADRWGSPHEEAGSVSGRS